MRRGATVLTVIATALLLGCGGSGVWVTKRPQFDYREMRTVAVAPFEDASGHPGTGRAVADELASLLVQNGSYRILPPDELKGLLADHDFSSSGEAAPSTAIAIGRLTGADALLTGTVLQYSCDVERHGKLGGGPGSGLWDDFHDVPSYRDGGRDRYEIDAEVAIGLALTSARTGEVLWLDSKKASFHAGGSRPRVGKSEALEEAAHTATKELVLGLVVHEEKVKIPRRSLFTCSAYIDHPIDSRTRFSTGDPSVYLVVDLNSEFVDKKLVVEVEKKDTGAAVATFSYTWDNACDTHAFKLKTEELIEKYGYGTYRATYDMDGKRMGRTDFRLVRE